MIEGKKWCNSCNQDRLLIDFSKDSSRKDGLQCKCRICDKQYGYEHRLEKRLKQKRYYRANRKKSLAYFAKYREEHKDRRRELYLTTKDETLNQLKEHRDTLQGHLLSRFNTLDQRCSNPNNVSFKRYGGKKIKNSFTFDSFYVHVVCDLGFDSVQELKLLQIHRKDNTKGYEVGNIMFLTQQDHKKIHVEIRKGKIND